ncbi:MAG: hypothetical protein JNL52_15315 [Flavobacteriales bacterium]|nr:hypothetical protein [Flavobacteriales bacterium]
MRVLLIGLLFVPLTVQAQDVERFHRALASGNVQALDRWMKHELHQQRKGHPVAASQGTYIVHGPTYDSLVAFLRRQPGVEDAAWDKCMGKLDIWPGHSRIGVRFEMNGVVHERCYGVQEGRPGQIRLFGWRTRVRKDREDLKYLGAAECLGFVEQQRKYCAERVR